MLLFAGTPCICSKYSFLIGTNTEYVKKLELRKSAGNTFYTKSGTSETIRNRVVNSENAKRVSDHVPRHLKPLNDEQLGHYLAGLIDGSGQFAYWGLTISFTSKDASLAYYIKTQIGYGNVRKSRYWTYHLDVKNEIGLSRVINLINGKLKRERIVNELVNNISSLENKIYPNINITMDLNNNFYNHWFSGFCDVHNLAVFQINFKRDGDVIKGIVLNFIIDHYDPLITSIAKEHLGGNINYSEPSKGRVYYNSISKGSAKKIINYFDKYHLQSKKHISYLKWRKVYTLQDKEHLTEKELIRIMKIEQSQISYYLALDTTRAL
jgi:hypothetical protein